MANSCKQCNFWRQRLITYKQHSQQIIEEMSKQIQQQKREIHTLNNKLLALNNKDGEHFPIHKTNTTFNDINIAQLQPYYTSTIQHHPFLQDAMLTFLSKTHHNKLAITTTPTSWRNWSLFYRCYLMDTILKSREKQLVLRTPLIIGLIFLTHNLPQPLWRFLEKLRITCAEETVRKWVELQMEQHQSPLLETTMSLQASFAILQPSSAISQPSSAISQPASAISQPASAISQPSHPSQSSTISLPASRTSQIQPNILSTSSLPRFVISPSPNLPLLLSFDNLDFFKHVTHPRTNHTSQMLHIVTKFILQGNQPLFVHLTNLWREFNIRDIGHWIQITPDECITLAQQCFHHLFTSYQTLPLKFTLHSTTNTLFASQMRLLPADINKSPSKVEDVESILQDFHNQFLLPFNRTFAIVSGDEQTFLVIWKLRKIKPDLYNWIIPIPGEWHWTWHILKGIFRAYGQYLLQPLSQHLHFPNFDNNCKKFHNAEDILQIITSALLLWISPAVKHPQTFSPIAFMHSIKPNSKPAYELLYFLFNYLTPYWVTRSALKVGNMQEVNNMWRYWTHLFIATGKTKYATMSIRFLWIQKAVNPDVLQFIN